MGTVHPNPYPGTEGPEDLHSDPRRHARGPGAPSCRTALAAGNANGALIRVPSDVGPTLTTASERAKRAQVARQTALPTTVR